DVTRALLPLYLSRLVLSSTFSGKKFGEIFTSAVIIATAYFLLTILSGSFQRKANYHYQRFMKKHQVNKAMTILEMDYEDTERDDVQNELVAIKQMEKTVAMGIYTFQEGFSILFGNSICIAIGIYLVWDLFFVSASDVEPWMSWGVNIAYLVPIFLLHYLAVKVDLKTMKIFADTARDIFSKNHRYLQQYSELLFDYKVGKDIRLYSEALAKNYNEQYRKRKSETYDVFARIFSSAGAKGNLISGAISVFTALFVGCKTLWGSVDITDFLLCIGVLELLFANIKEWTEAFGKILSSDALRKKFIHLFTNKEVRIEPLAETSSPSDRASVLSEARPESFDLPSDLSLKKEYRDAPDIAEVPTIEFQNVRFKYPNSEVMVLKNINLKIYGNQKLALVGLNGSGKTTLIKLLLGLYAPTDGKILIEGEDTANWNRERFVEYFSAVFQDFKLFSLKVGENVAGAKEIDEKLVTECLKKTGLSKFCEKNGIDAFLYRDFDDSGIEISGGEAQKIAMARAIYHNGKFFVLDEPTAALDPLSEYEIYTHFGEITSDHPAIYISHRLSSCIFCDVVAVMDSGQIVQIGTHERLLEDTNGVYSKLWNAQAKHYKNQP
ncbi:MAG: ABC transporter ATP-binding protein, partial [Peptostreptococcaceae bacterium]|nr:ABC transporter ATP-binding protein [Peptostreptococcaceae bacterium]